MKRKTILLFLFLIIGQFAIAQDTLALTKDPRPNILLIVADDLGYSDLGSYGSEIATPFLDKIAAQGIRFSNFHTMPTCSPTRSILLTGTDNHLAGIGAQQGAVTKKQNGNRGYEGHLSPETASLPEVLRAANYRTYLSGKWHLGEKDEHAPIKRGFQETFALMPGGASHYADQKPLHPKEPTVYRRNGKVLENLPDDFYSTKNYTDSLLSWIERDKNSDHPFFAYLAYTAPHDPLQAPIAYINKYKGVYNEGYEIFREKRMEGLQAKGIIPSSQTLPPWPSIIPRWEDLPSQKKQETLRDMETYSAMIDYMDEQIGRIYNWLEQNDALDNTIIFFMSDNGASGLNSKKIYPSFTEEYGRQFNNELSNRGLINSFTNMYVGWAVASTVHFREFKGSSAEGGIRTPFFIKPVAQTSSSKKKYNNTDKNVCATFTHVSDLMPTILNMANAEHPSTENTDLIKMRGKSLLPILENPTIDIHKEEGIGYELHGTRAYIKDGWKILQSPMPLGSGDWELYNLNEDPSEQKNLVFSHTDKLKELVAAYQVYEKEVGVVYDLPLFLKPPYILSKIIFWLIIVIFAIAILGKLSGKLKDKYHKWGYGTGFMYGLAVVEMIAVGGLFTFYNQYAAKGLLVIMAGAFFTLIKNREKWKTYLLPFFSTVLLGLFLYLKSGWMTAMLL